MNDKGKTVKTVRISKRYYTDTKRRGKSVNILVHLELSDGMSTNGIAPIMDAYHIVENRVLNALAKEFLP